MITLNYMDVVAVKNALKGKRQFTFGEQQQAESLLRSLSQHALRHFHATHPNKTADAGDSNDVRMLKHRGLLEVAMFAEDAAADLDDETRQLVSSLLGEALNGFAQGRHHHSAINLPGAGPSSLATPRAVNTVAVDIAARASLDALASEVDRLGNALVDASARADTLESRLLALESAVTLPSSAPSAPSAQPPDASGMKEGES